MAEAERTVRPGAGREGRGERRGGANGEAWSEAGGAGRTMGAGRTVRPGPAKGGARRA